jgi:hypothetical protein
MNESKDETEQRLIRRLESFSDIIIGFSLAQLALSLAIPKNGALGLLENPGRADAGRSRYRIRDHGDIDGALRVARERNTVRRLHHPSVRDLHTPAVPFLGS